MTARRAKSLRDHHKIWHHLMRDFVQRMPSLMRTTVAIDDELLAEAQRLTGLNGTMAIVREALSALVERESARRLARLGGTDPAARDVPRRRPAPQ
jgi:Arc/MetJ family transcription regulator